jgi:hypothetical protein
MRDVCVKYFALTEHKKTENPFCLFNLSGSLQNKDGHPKTSAASMK